MPKRSVKFEQGGYYHLYNRGAGRQSIFRQERNYWYLLRLMGKVAKECDHTIVAYSLLPNHYHWCVRQDGETSISRLPQRVFGSYTQALNVALNRRGTLFEDRFDAIKVETIDYQLNLCRYIHANPVLHGFAAAPELWPYSNYLDWIGQRPGNLIDRAFVHAHFPEPGQYQSYVNSYLINQSGLPPGLKTYLARLEQPSRPSSSIPPQNTR